MRTYQATKHAVAQIKGVLGVPNFKSERILEKANKRLAELEAQFPAITGWIAISQKEEFLFDVKVKHYPEMCMEYRGIKIVSMREFIAKRASDWKRVGAKSLYFAYCEIGKVWKSYNTIIAYEKNGNLYLRRGAKDFSCTTSRHVNEIILKSHNDLNTNIVFEDF